jgi:hypothetical protein
MLSNKVALSLKLILPIFKRKHGAKKPTSCEHRSDVLHPCHYQGIGSCFTHNPIILPLEEYKEYMPKKTKNKP